MKHILLFGGTSEGRALCEALAALPVRVTACVATEYGGDLLQDVGPGVRVRVGRMGASEMEALMRGEDFDRVIDATHPYAVAVSENIRTAAGRAGLPYDRLIRDSGGAMEAVCVASVAEAVAHLARTEGKILAATGVKELDAYTGLPAYRERVYARVLPSVESVARCAELGFPGSHIIAMQGPFSREMNEALMRQFGISWMVTKEGGGPGGFAEKMEAAAACNVRVLVIGRPAETEGMPFHALLRTIRERIREKA